MRNSRAPAKHSVGRAGMDILAPQIHLRHIFINGHTCSCKVRVILVMLTKLKFSRQTQGGKNAHA